MRNPLRIQRIAGIRSCFMHSEPALSFSRQHKCFPTKPPPKRAAPFIDSSCRRVLRRIHDTQSRETTETPIGRDKCCAILHRQSGEECVIYVIATQFHLRTEAGQDVEVLLAGFYTKHGGLILECAQEAKYFSGRGSGCAECR